MNQFEIFLFNFIFIICPLMLYLFYIAYNKNISKKTNSLVFNIVLLTIFYLLIKFDGKEYGITFLMISIIPLIIAYIKKDYLSIILLSFVGILCEYNLFEFNIIFLIIKFFLFYTISLFLNKKLLYLVFIFIQCIFTIVFLDNNNLSDIGNILIMSLLALIIYKFVIILMEYGEKILKYHFTIKELEQEKQIHNSLFKITHEIKNPLAVCKGYFDMMNIDDDEQVKRYLPIIKEEIDHTLVLLKDFLSITRIKVEKEIMDANMLVEDVSNSFKPIFKNKNIKSKIDIIDDEVYINGDYNRLKQVLINILKNSIESINDKEGNISISTEIKNNNFEIIIKDNGIGMSSEVIKHLYEPFYTTKTNGTGLGITLSKEILTQHNAHLEYNSVYKKGTSVLITIPIEKSV